MKKISLVLVALILAGCAPSVTVEKPTTDSRTFKATCEQALAAVATTAPQIKPASLGGLGSWGAFQVVDRQPGGLTVQSQTARTGMITYGVVTTNQNTTTVNWRCTETNGQATLTASSTGQRGDYAQAVLNAFWDNLNLPRP